MNDQFIISPFQEYSGSMSDGVYYGNILSNNATNQTTVIVDVGVTESIDPFKRTKIWSKGNAEGTTELRKRNILYSDRIKYKTNKGFGGNRFGNAFMQASTQGEQYFDSLLPSPLDIAQTNGIKYGLLPAGYGLLASSSNFNLPPAGGLTDIPILFGISVPPSLSEAEACIDTTWLKNPFPFQTKYKALPRITSNTFVLPEKRNVEVDLVTGALISPVSQSNMVGTVYFLSNQEFSGFANSIYEGEDIGDETAAVFTEMSYPTGLDLQNNFFGSHAHDFPGGIFGFFSEAQQIVVGEDGIIIKREQGSLGWTIVQAAGTGYDLYDAAHSRGPNSFGFIQFGYWVIVGSGAGRLLRSDSYNLSTALVAATPAGGFTGTFYGVAFEADGGSYNAANRFVAVGSDGEIQCSTGASAYDGSTWGRPTGGPYGGATFDFKAVDYNPLWDVFIAVGDAGTIYVSTATDATAVWTPVTHVGNLLTLTDNLRTVRCHFGTGYTVVAGENGAIAVCDNNPASEGNWLNITPPTANHINGSARTIDTAAPTGPDILFYLVGAGGTILAGSNGGQTWTEVVESPNNSSQEFKTITSYNVWPDPAKYWPTTGDYIVAGLFDTTTRPGVGRVVDIESTGYTFLSSSDFVGFVNTGDTIELGGAGTAANSTYVRSTYEDSFKAFYGFGKGVQVSFPENFDPNVITFMPGVSPDFYDAKTIQDDFQIESVRLFGPKPLGYHFGIYNTNPIQTKCMFRRDHYGQPRDLMEQRPVTKFFLQDSITGKTTTTKGPVVVSFVSGTMSHSRSLAYAEATSTVSFNRKDSGIYDIECRAGQPFFDDQLGITDLIDEEIGN